ncbi:hypothetical protein JW921_09935 [Candidatus Fermentibacterales bacterium]|nr:hypothetical protein [Candidatus Fermentibacterales bacterium]
MSLFLTALLSMSLVAGGGSSTPGKYSVYGFLGYGMSAFDEDFLDPWDQEAYVPAGAQFFYQVSPKFQVGAEFELCAKEFSWEEEYYEAGYYWDETLDLSMTTIGLVGRYFIAESFFARGGVASYSGSVEYYDEWYGYTVDGDLESGIGFNIGGGYLTNVSPKVYAGVEGVYHIVSLEPEDFNESYDFNHWAFRGMIGTGF